MSRIRLLRRIFLLLITLMLLLNIFSGCSKNDVDSEETEDGPIELWVVTEKTPWDGMNAQARTLIKEFEETHDNVTVKLDILPVDPEKREIYLDKLRVQILAGKGPDVYLLPTGTWMRSINPRNPSEIYTLSEKIFADESMTMHNGHFLDISEYYDADDALDKEELITGVMDAGVLDGARYILPLRYDYPMIYAATDRLESLNTDLEVLKSGVITDIMDLAIETNNRLLADGGITAYYQTNWSSNFLVHLPQLVDYDRGKINLSVEEVAEFLGKFQKDFSISANKFASHGLADSSELNADGGYMMNGIHVGNEENVLTSGSLHNVVEMIAVSKAAGVDLTMIPVRNADGELVASVTYYGAVGSSSEYPEIAYEYLRLFLLEKSQWEANRKWPSSAQVANFTFRPATWGYIELGFPVRSLCEPEVLWQAYHSILTEPGCKVVFYRMQFEAFGGARSRYNGVKQAELSEEDLAVLNVPIDRAVFDQTFGMELSATLYDFALTQTVTPEEWAEKIVKTIEMYLAEG